MNACCFVSSYPFSLQPTLEISPEALPSSAISFCPSLSPQQLKPGLQRALPVCPCKCRILPHRGSSARPTGERDQDSCLPVRQQGRQEGPFLSHEGARPLPLSHHWEPGTTVAGVTRAAHHRGAARIHSREGSPLHSSPSQFCCGKVKAAIWPCLPYCLAKCTS